MEDLDFLNEHNLVFVDIEATDDKNDRRIIQFSGIKYNQNKDEIGVLDLIFNPDQALSNHIINLLKTDDVTLSKELSFESKKEEILSFLQQSTVITFGDFDIYILKKYLPDYEEYEIKWFDFQKFLKRFSNSNVPLAQMHLLINDQLENKYQHNALYDAEMLKNIYYFIKDIDDNEKLQRLCFLSHLMPREVTPRHKIFNKNDFVYQWHNKPNSNKSPIIISQLEIGTISIKQNKTKQNLHFLKRMRGYFADSRKKIEFISPFFIDGEHTYNFYLDEIKNYMNNFLFKNEYRGFIFENVSKDKINWFLEIIYDVTKKYPVLNYVNINHLRKKYKDHSYSLIDYFFDEISQEDEITKKKLIGYYLFRSSYKEV